MIPAVRSKSIGEEQLEVTDKKIFFYIGAAEALSQVGVMQIFQFIIIAG